MINPKGQNLLIRTATGIVFVAVVLAAMLIGGRGTYTALLLVIACYCTTELLRLARGRTQKWLGTLYIVLCVIAMWFFPMIGSGMSGAGGIIGKDSPLLSGSFDDWDVRIAPAFMAVVWANDVFAYLVGISVGRHRMCPRISPHKSWEGFVGGIVGATATSAFIGRFWTGGDVWLWTAFGLIVALTAVGGDLAESRLKRAAGVKDSGNLLPGHGGLLDRFDAMLGAVPAAFLFFLITYFTK